MYLARSSPTVLTWFMDASSSGLQRPHSGTPRPPGASTPSRPLPGGRPEGAHLALDPAATHAAQAGHHRVLMHVKAGAKRMKKVHCSLLCCVAGSGSPFKEL